MLSRFTVRAAMAAVLAITLTGCTPSANGDNGNGTGAGAPSAVDAKAALAAAVSRTTGINLTFVLTGNSASDNLTGGYDAASRFAAFAQAPGAESLSVTVGPDDLYLAGLSDFAGQTVHVDIAKIAANNPLAVFTDALGALTLLSAVVTAESTAANTFAGTLDLTKAQGATAGAQKFVQHLLTGAGDKAGAVKFTAKVDPQGYLTEFSATLPGLDEGRDSGYEVTFADFGKPITNAKPTEQIMEAPESFYAT